MIVLPNYSFLAKLNREIKSMKTCKRKETKKVNEKQKLREDEYQHVHNPKRNAFPMFVTMSHVQ